MIRRSYQWQSSEEQLRLWRAGGDDENEAHQQSRPVSFGPNSWGNPMSVRLLPFGYPPENPSKYPLQIKSNKINWWLYFRQKRWFNGFSGEGRKEVEEKKRRSFQFKKKNELNWLIGAVGKGATAWHNIVIPKDHSFNVSIPVSVHYSFYVYLVYYFIWFGLIGRVQMGNWRHLS